MIPVVILNWNGDDDTVECLRSIAAADCDGFLPVVVDNGSRPESRERVRAEGVRLLGDARWLFVESAENLGFAAGCNFGIARAAARLEGGAPEWVMVLNNDTEVAPDLFARLRAFIAEHPEFVAVTAQIRDFASRGTIQNCGGDLTWLGSRRYRFAGREAAGLGLGAFDEVTFATGCAFLYRQAQTGPLTEEFFFGEEDYEFALRLQRRGLRMACVNGAVAYHKGGATIARSSRALGMIRHYYAVRLIDTRRYYSAPRWLLTKAAAYGYAPLLLARLGVSPARSLGLIRDISRFVATHQSVGKGDFEALTRGA